MKLPFGAGALFLLLAFFGAAERSVAADLSRPASRAALKIVAIDVEGGAATLFVTPQGHSLLVDTGWPTGMGSPRPAPGATPSPVATSAEHILAAAKKAGLSKIDYLLITHYHVDHVGGLDNLLALMPVGAFIDHGPNREDAPATATPEQLARSTQGYYAKYLAAIAGKPRITLAAGDNFKIDDLILTVVNGDRKLITEPLAGAGKANPTCVGVTEKSAIGAEENPRSLGFVATFGAARILQMGDTTWNIENELACPVGKIGPVDIFFTSHHGVSLSNSPTFLASIAPTVAITANGATKGADPETFDTLKATPSIRDVWQLHTASKNPAKNPPVDLIANLEGAADAGYPLEISVEASGQITVLNPRNGVARTYSRGR